MVFYLELYTRLSPTSIVEFIDHKNVFGTANKEIILDHLVDFGVKGRLLKWIRGYLSNRTACVLFKSTCSTPKRIKMGTPQGVLSLLLFNVLMHCFLYSLTSLELQLPAMQITFPSTLIHHRISSSSTPSLIHQQPVVSFTNWKKKKKNLPQPKNTSRIYYGGQNYHSLLAISLLGRTCTSHSDNRYTTEDSPHYQGPSGSTTAALHPRQMARHQCRRSFYPCGQNHLCDVHEMCRRLPFHQLSKSALELLKKNQNRVKPFIMGCSASTRVGNMQSEYIWPHLLTGYIPTSPISMSDAWDLPISDHITSMSLGQHLTQAYLDLTFGWAAATLLTLYVSTSRLIINVLQ